MQYPLNDNFNIKLKHQINHLGYKIHQTYPATGHYNNLG